jgi:hypothetical protein
MPLDGFQLKFCMPFSSPIACICSAHLILLDVIILLFGEEKNWCDSSLCNFLHRPIICFFLDPNIILSQIYILPVGFHVSHPCMTELKDYYLLLGSRDSAVGMATGYGLDSRGARVRVPVGARFFFSQRRPDRFWGPRSLLSNGCRGLLPKGKATGARSWPLTSN